ncbi:hypothetical protein SARC_04422 [Sphaeroforma arctica JP610]|uniref:Uncharacterized protein n=1 Tax=Sphaeroforma arctica JP610 TaxID=667725 RepID=A0A0L0G2G5_9EUKA|nr:hypothetical protein, variant [Sphaeroforma arctica JP610]XP_014157229.1 hypothetical protein SARC_04422 [Sphaeroforma arctica JP610]KNC83326.1 hypothetical protein, variant [Sphaeroforma arctica JP610]KNC83327.1 hypothetical protein SARC_04422 [Sphaeroforma arctica JP610]|eukprot:XP_014157228.1 hypothetical protein, variant [Sphaeroforma arctica JP610]
MPLYSDADPYYVDTPLLSPVEPPDQKNFAHIAPGRREGRGRGRGGRGGGGREGGGDRPRGSNFHRRLNHRYNMDDISNGSNYRQHHSSSNYDRNDGFGDSRQRQNQPRDSYRGRER